MAERKKVAYALRSREIEVPATPAPTPQDPQREGSEAEDEAQGANARPPRIRPEGWKHTSLGHPNWIWTSPEVTYRKSDFNSQRIIPGRERFATPNPKVTGKEVVRVTIQKGNKGTLWVRAGSQLHWEPSAPYTKELGSELTFLDVHSGFKFQEIPADSDLAALIAADKNIVAILKIGGIMGMILCNQDAAGAFAAGAFAAGAFAAGAFAAEPTIDEVLQDMRISQDGVEGTSPPLVPQNQDEQSSSEADNDQAGDASPPSQYYTALEEMDPKQETSQQNNAAGNEPKVDDPQKRQEFVNSTAIDSLPVTQSSLPASLSAITPFLNMDMEPRRLFGSKFKQGQSKDKSVPDRRSPSFCQRKKFSSTNDGDSRKRNGSSQDGLHNRYDRSSNTNSGRDKYDGSRDSRSSYSSRRYSRSRDSRSRDRRSSDRRSRDRKSRDRRSSDRRSRERRSRDRRSSDRRSSDRRSRDRRSRDRQSRDKRSSDRRSSDRRSRDRKSRDRRSGDRRSEDKRSGDSRSRNSRSRDSWSSYRSSRDSRSHYSSSREHGNALAFLEYLYSRDRDHTRSHSRSNRDGRNSRDDRTRQSFSAPNRHRQVGAPTATDSTSHRSSSRPNLPDHHWKFPGPADFKMPNVNGKSQGARKKRKVPPVFSKGSRGNPPGTGNAHTRRVRNYRLRKEAEAAQAAAAAAAAEAAATDPTAVDPAAIDPAVADSAATDFSATDSAATDSAATDSVAADSTDATDPETKEDEAD